MDLHETERRASVGGDVAAIGAGHFGTCARLAGQTPKAKAMPKPTLKATPTPTPAPRPGPGPTPRPGPGPGLRHQGASVVR